MLDSQEAVRPHHCSRARVSEPRSFEGRSRINLPAAVLALRFDAFGSSYQGLRLRNERGDGSFDRFIGGAELHVTEKLPLLNVIE